MKSLIKIVNVVCVNYVLLSVIYLTMNPNNIPYTWFFETFKISPYFSGDPIITMTTLLSIIAIIPFNYLNLKSSVNNK